ncbi:MAG: polysaccharide deacetylase family protein [Candidatus Rokubacteria bacterium]|nr:polysaccharide deacetylase family protein [Candidatus Rokubacteria bacterium]
MPVAGSAAAVAHGVMFHHFHGGRHPVVQGSISAAQLERLIRSLDTSCILSPEEWLAKLDAGRLAASDRCLTFDDALLSQVDIALPVLDAYRLKAFWFVYSSVFEGAIARFEVYRMFRCRFFPDIDMFYALFFERVTAAFAIDARAAVPDGDVDRVRNAYPFYSANDVRFRVLRDRLLTNGQYDAVLDGLIADRGLTLAELAAGLWMSADHLRSLSAAGHIVGLHSYSHPMRLGDLPDDEQRSEYEANFRHLTQICGRPPITVAHPANSYSDRTIEILTDLGVRCGFRANMAPRLPGHPLNASALELAREDHANLMRRLEAQRDTG